MKRFLALFSLALLVLGLVLTSTFTLTASADDGNGNTADNVVYISDSAVEGGKGTSEQDPLYPTTLPDAQLDPREIDQTQPGESINRVTIKSNYKNTALYQAVEKLSETGGTVVICGNYTINQDDVRQTNHYTVSEYHLPETRKTVNITSKYNGVDYAENNGAKLTLSGDFYTILNGPTVWENMTIHAALAPDRAICCNGNKTVFGEGLNCETEGSSDGSWLSIVGGARYSAMNTDVDVTIKSGRFYKFIGTTWQKTDNDIVCCGDVNLTLAGGTVSYIYGNTHNTVPNSLHKGNVNITITGGAIDAQTHNSGRIVCTGSGGFESESSTVNIRITGGTFDGNFRIVSRMAAVETKGVESNNINVDLSGALSVTDDSLNQIVSNLPNGANVTYPADWINGTLSVIDSPAEDFVFSGDMPSSKGAKLGVVYQNPISNREYPQTIEYSKNNPAFTADYILTTNGKANATYYFENEPYLTAEIDVIDVPRVNIEGVQIRIDTNKQQMYGWGNYTKDECPGVTIKECGIISLPSDMLTTDEPFDHSNTYGMYDAEADRQVNTASNLRFGALVFGNEVIRENNYNRDYSIRAYVKIEYDGKEYYRYSDVIKRCFYDVAKSAIAGDKEDEKTKDWLNENVINVHANYDKTFCYYPEGSEDARKKVVDYMYAMSDIPWTPQKTFIIYNDGGSNQYSVGSGSTRMYGVFYAGETYYGIPYVNSTLSQFESFRDVIDYGNITPIDTNVEFKNGTDFRGLTHEQKEAGLANAKIFPGNDCWAALIFAWNSVLNNREDIKGLTSLDSMINMENGTIPVGDYEINSSHLNDTKAMIDNIGEQKIAKAYAQLKPGDATVYRRDSNSRHVRIVRETPYTVYNTDGTINLESSYVNFIHQAGGADIAYIYNQNCKSLKEKGPLTFEELIIEGSLPVTIPELTTGNVDTPFAFALGLNLEEDLPNGMLNGTIKANKQMISVRAEIKDANGESVGEKKDILVTTYSTLQLAKYNLTRLDLSEIELTEGEKYTFDLYTCISGMDGEEIHLVDGYEFTANKNKDVCGQELTHIFGIRKGLSHSINKL